MKKHACAHWCCVYMSSLVVFKCYQYKTLPMLRFSCILKLNNRTFNQGILTLPS